MPDRMREVRLVAVLAAMVLVAPLGSARADAAAPAAPQPVPVVLDGVHAVVRWRNDAAATRVVVRRVAGTVAPAGPLDGEPVFDGPPDQASLQLATDTVVVGATYTYGYWSYGASGDVSAEAIHSIKATAPPLLKA
ncbi:MAG: hypothetical protein QOI76_252, partial [Frankiales bacterium]|nr:hypothetical protein [Frankiales bacterium]